MPGDGTYLLISGLMYGLEAVNRCFPRSKYIFFTAVFRKAHGESTGHRPLKGPESMFRTTFYTLFTDRGGNRRLKNLL